MRSVQVVNTDSGDSTRAEHVIGIDESGTFIEDEVAVLVSVRSARSDSERLAELLVECELDPWVSKSDGLAARRSRAERDSRVADLLSGMDGEPHAWCSAVSYSSTSLHQKAAALCVLAKKTVTGACEFSGDAVVIPDGDRNMYGRNQRYVRQQASQTFGGSFQTAYGDTYISSLPNADYTYPEVIAADYIAGYVRSQILRHGTTISEFPETVVQCDRNWREPETSPGPFYRLQPALAEFGNDERDRVVAWLRGRHPEGDSYDGSGQFVNTVRNVVESDVVQEYLLEF